MGDLINFDGTTLKGQAQTPTDGGGMIIDVRTADFEEKVLKKSLAIPVIADFWAPWCGPCKALTPLLESEVKKAKGKVLLAKINMDENPQLAQALQIQSVPTIYAFYQSQPVTAFAGARSQREIASLVNQLVELSGSSTDESAEDIDTLLDQAQEALIQNNPQQAAHIYRMILEHDSSCVPAYCGLIKSLVGQGHIDKALSLADRIDPSFKSDIAFAPALALLDLAREFSQTGMSLSELEKRHAENPQDFSTKLNLANGLFLAGRSEEAVKHLMTILTADREWQDGKARSQLLNYFEGLGPSHPLTQAGRRQLSSLLFS